MNESLAHRGPDDDGTFFFENVGLGHRRLAIIDLSERGHQPMSIDSGRFVITFNGEIYNYLELRKELSLLGASFASTTDTEVILQAYKFWGIECLQRFIGMWAFAILDTHKRELFLSRDRLGIKPLYYANTPEGFIFASEIKALTASHPELKQADLKTIARFIPTGAFADSNDTFFNNVSSFPAGFYGTLDLGTKTLKLNEYWALQSHYSEDSSYRLDPVERLRELLEDSIRLRMQADVPVGTCLSGGLDSSAIVSNMSKLSSSPVHTFSGLYNDPQCNEQVYASLVNQHCSTVSHPVFPEPTGSELLNVLSDITWHQDAPTAGPGLITQYYVMKEASNHVKVLLDGQGGDELFGGYLYYLGPRIHDLLNGSSMKNTYEGLKLAASVIAIWGPRWLATIPSGGAASVLALPMRSLRRARHTFMTADSENEILTKDLKAFLYPHYKSPPDKSIKSNLNNELYLDTKTRSIPGLLHYEDRNSMAFSIEARVPYLDHRIVEFAFSIPDEYKIKGSWTKWILRKAAEPLLPNTVTWRRSKMGYPTPFARWLRSPQINNSLEEMLLSNTAKSREMISRKACSNIWDQHQRGKRDYSWLIYRLISLELWQRQFLN